MDRRSLIHAAAGASLFAVLGPAAAAETTRSSDATAFDDATVRRLARELAGKPFQPPELALPAALDPMTYDQYRGIRFRPERALWRDRNLPFQAQFFSRGFLYRERVEMFEVADGQASPIAYSPGLFEHADPTTVPAGDPETIARLGFAGFRIHAPIHRPDEFSEFCVFLGASYFRAVGRGQTYGLSARGLSIRTGDPGIEEFARFTQFWLERPQPGAASLVIHALLDTPSTTGAYRFAVRPGEDTVFEVACALYPRADLASAGIATLTSMYFFDAADRRGIDDWRPAVHDSEGLSMTSAGIAGNEAIWRPLANPKVMQISAFAETGPTGFGLMQRKRAFSDYLDPAVLYNKRPSLWVEPAGDWGSGTVELVEIPTSNETEDNIVSFWRPREKLAANAEHVFTYRLYWGWADAAGPTSSALGRFTDTRVGEAEAPGSRFFVLDLGGEAMRRLVPDAAIRADIGASAGRIENVIVAPVTELAGWRISFDLVPGDAKLIEMHCFLANDHGPLSETWIYRWIA